MVKKDLNEYRKKYDIARHHAWAGAVLLSVFSVLTVLLRTSDISDIPDYLILVIGLGLVLYTVISLFFTYRYRSGLLISEKVVKVEVSSRDTDLEKERLKAEKKKAKAEAKRTKKTKK